MDQRMVDSPRRRRVASPSICMYTSLCSTEVSLQLCIKRCIVNIVRYTNGKRKNLAFDLSNLNCFLNSDFEISPRDS